MLPIPLTRNVTADLPATACTNGKLKKYQFQTPLLVDACLEDTDSLCTYRWVNAQLLCNNLLHSAALLFISQVTYKLNSRCMQCMHAEFPYTAVPALPSSCLLALINCLMHFHMLDLFEKDLISTLCLHSSAFALSDAAALRSTCCS